ncbi:MAG: hypothetical protein WCX22_11330 [Methanoregula sp.]
MPPSQKPDPRPDPATDILLFRSARFSSYTFSEVKSGTDIYMKITPGRTVKFYLLHWSERPGEMNECTAIPEDCTIRILRALAATPVTLPGMEFKNIYRYLPGYYLDEPRVPGTGDDEKNSFEYFRKPPEVQAR